jgi:membrane protease YdiL (CAAX protease family)
MSENFFKNTIKIASLMAWVLGIFFVASFVVAIVIRIVAELGIGVNTDSTVFNFSFAAIVYTLATVLVIGLPWWIRKKKTTKKELGLDRLVSWGDLLITPAGLVVYFVLSAMLVGLAINILPWFDINQSQDVGFDNLIFRYEYTLAFVALVVIAPFAEEVLFRGYLYGKIKHYAPVWLAIILSSVLFGVAHGAWNVGVDTFALGIILCLLREITGSLWASIFVHMAKNGLAYYLLFINPVL